MHIHLLTAVIVFAIFCSSCNTMRDTFIQAVPQYSDIELADDVLEAALKARNAQTQVKEQAHWILTAPAARRQLRILSGRIRTNHSELTKARATMKRVLSTFREAAKWPEPEMFQIPLAKSAPVIDGKLNDEAWQNAAVFNESYSYDYLQPVGGNFTTYRMLWDKNALYFAFECKDEYLNAPTVEQESDVVTGDAVGIYLLPVFRTMVYWEVLISPLGKFYDALNAKKTESWGAITRPEENVAGLQVQARFQGTANRNSDVDEGYTVEVAIPFDQLPGYMRNSVPETGDILHFMLTRHDLKDKEVFTRYAFQPLMASGHNIWNYYQMRLVE